MALMQTMEQEANIDAKSARLPTSTSPLETPVKLETAIDSRVNTPQAGNNRQSVTLSLGVQSHETYCSIVLVTCNADSVLALNLMVPTHSWSDLIAWDICTHQLGVPANTIPYIYILQWDYIMIPVIPPFLLPYCEKYSL